MSHLTRDAGDAPAVAPYGLVGLVISTLVILAASACLLLLIAVAALGLAAARLGWHGALEALVKLAPTLKADGQAADRVNIVVGGTGYLVTAGCVVLVARFRGGAQWADLVGWHGWDMSRSLKLGAALLAATLCYSVAASSLIESVYPQAKEWMTTPTGTPWIIGFIALATLLAPITEELLFRGWIYTSLREVIGVRFGILLSAMLFALAHWESTHLYAVAVFPVGLALGYIRQRAGSVAASITFHALYNGIAAVLLFVGK